MNDITLQIQNLLNTEQLADNLTPLFCHTLLWGAPPRDATRSLAVGAPVNTSITIRQVAQLSGLPVFRVDWMDNRLPGIVARRAVQRALKPIHAEHLVCYITSDRKQAAFVWARTRADGKTELRTLSYEVNTPARTTIEQLAKLAFSLDELEKGEPLITTITDKLNSAFSVEAVTKKFYEDYKKIFADLQTRLYKKSRNKKWAHDYALQFLNRLMFLYFIQRKGWLGNNPRFIAEFWHVYKTSRQPEDTFFDRWLSVLFFEAFNNKFQAGRHDRQHLPTEIRSVLATAPYLNGGLFAQNQLDEAYDVQLPDDFFTMLFDYFDGSSPGFLERYNFTISESTPLDIEVAVDPEMIGKVYESLVNITFEGLTEEDMRGSAGIFYTPRVEIDLMCRLALVDTLSNHLGNDKKPLLYDVIFAHDPDEKEAADRALAEHNLWQDLNRLLRQLTVCDPACGSGSFLVGMLMVLDDLQARASAQLNIKETPYERRRRIIGEQLYGVDVMDWAVHVAELRLWLQLVVETELSLAELHFRPLLPNLSFKIRCGDSLVQEVGGINFNLHKHQLAIPSQLKGRITRLKNKKLQFYQGESSIREADIKLEELAIFRDILEHKRLVLQKEIAVLKRQIEGPPLQGELSGIATVQAKQQRLKLEEQWRTEFTEKQAELKRVEQTLAALSKTQYVPFVWDIAFVEIFGGTPSTASRSNGGTGSTPSESNGGSASTPTDFQIEGPGSTPSRLHGGTPSTASEPGAGDTAPSNKSGFDIVIGNPPYVRQEMIAPPALDPADYGGESSDRWKEQKKAYKARLQESVAAAWTRFFRYKPGSNTFRKLDGKSDLYIYFYFHGLSLLNPRGSFCFITSNSWLDVGYGADLQEFLLRHSHVKFILDNERKRSFAQADVNTIIALLAPPDDNTEFGGTPSTVSINQNNGGTGSTLSESNGGSASTPTESNGRTGPTPSASGAGKTAPSNQIPGGTGSTLSESNGGAPSTPTIHPPSPLARFVMFKVPFEDVLNADTFKALEAVTGRQSTDKWRISVVSQRDLFEESLDHDEDDDGETSAGETAPSMSYNKKIPTIGGTPSTASINQNNGGTGSTLSESNGGSASTPTESNGRTGSTPSASGAGKTAASNYSADGTAPSNHGAGKTAPSRNSHFATVHIKTTRYHANKWGGKYLRAPEIFFTILEKGKGKLVRLGDIAEVRFGIKTGANEFFYLEPTGKPAPRGYIHVRNGAGWEGEIEEEFLKPVVSSTSEIKRLILKKSDAKTLLFYCPLTINDLKRQRCQGTLSYIEWGAKLKTRAKGKHTVAGVLLPHAPTVRTNKPSWYSVKPNPPGAFIVPRLIRERFFFADNPDGVSETDMFFHGYVDKFPRTVSALLNSTLTYLLLEIMGRQGIEGRFNVYGPELNGIILIDPFALSESYRRDLNTAFARLGIREIAKIIDELSQPDRRALDDIIFDVLGLTQGEREAVYEAVINLVRNRLEKARSV